MNLNIPESSELRLRLRDHQIFSMPDAAGMTLECLAGGVWVTFDGDRADHFLQPGERFHIATGGQAVIQALQDSEVALLAGIAGLKVCSTAPASRVSPASAGPMSSDVCRNTAESATGGWRNLIASLSASRLGLERTF